VPGPDTSDDSPEKMITSLKTKILDLEAKLDQTRRQAGVEKQPAAMAAAEKRMDELQAQISELRDELRKLTPPAPVAAPEATTFSEDW